MTLLVPKNIQNNYLSYEVHLLNFCLLHYLLSSDSNAMMLHIVLSLFRSLFEILIKEKLNCSFTAYIKSNSSKFGSTIEVLPSNTILTLRRKF